MSFLIASCLNFEQLKTISYFSARLLESDFFTGSFFPVQEIVELVQRCLDILDGKKSGQICSIGGNDDQAEQPPSRC